MSTWTAATKQCCFGRLAALAPICHFAADACREKIKVENMGPISYCGGAPPKARKAATAGVTAEIKKKV
jgi:hypothetical protein